MLDDDVPGDGGQLKVPFGVLQGSFGVLEAVEVVALLAVPPVIKEVVV